MAMNMDAMLRIKADVQGENNIRRLGNSMQGLQGQVKNAAAGFNNFKGAVAGLGAAIAGSAIVGGLSAVVKRSIDAGDELFNLQAKTGIAATALTGIGNAAKLADVDLATLGKGLTKLNINLVNAAQGNEALARKFQALGVQVKDSNGQIVPADQALKQIADRFADMPDGAQKAAAAVALFGKAGADLIPLLNEGAASMEEFTYKVSDDFAARSDLFNDTITKLGIKTQGFGMELTDALLPALQSILEVFSDLFSTDQDWTALFKVIEVGIRGVAVVIYAVVKAVDILIKNIVAAVQAAQAAFSGDFVGAWNVITSRVTSGIEEQKKILSDLKKLAFGSAKSPGPGLITGGRSMDLDTTDADARAAAEARRRAAELKRAATEQERLAERRNDLTQQAISLQRDLRQSLEDLNSEYAGIGASDFDRLSLERDDALRNNQRTVDNLTLSLVQLEREINKAGGSLDTAPFIDLINQIADAGDRNAFKNFSDGLSNLLGEEVQAVDEAVRAYYELNQAKSLNVQITDGLKSGLNAYIEQLGTLSDALGSVAQNAFQGVEDAIFSLVTTGKANFREFAADILRQTARMIIQQLILKAIMQAIGFGGGGGGGLLSGLSKQASSGFSWMTTPMANGGIMTGDGPLPLKKYASGGIANTPQLAMFGEGSMPEAYVPLPDGRRIPVAMKGGGGGTVVNVSVDATGSSLQGNAGQGERLGRVIAQAVQAELIRQKRPGGLLMAA